MKTIVKDNILHISAKAIHKHMAVDMLFDSWINMVMSLSNYSDIPGYWGYTTEDDRFISADAAAEMILLFTDREPVGDVFKGADLLRAIRKTRGSIGNYLVSLQHQTDALDTLLA